MNKYFIFEIKTGILRAAQSTITGARNYIKEGCILVISNPNDCEKVFNEIISNDEKLTDAIDRTAYQYFCKVYA